MNQVLLRRIADVIEANPEVHDQSDWSSNASDPLRCAFIDVAQAHTCGTTACIAGWAVHLTPVDERPEAESISECAAKLLGLNERESETLFNGDWSPREGVTVPQELRRIAEQQSIGETATAGWKGTATAGNMGTATAGDEGTATAGDMGTATAGENGVIVAYRIKNGNRVPTAGVIGETVDAAGEVLKAGQAYQLNGDGKFVAVVK